MDFIEELRLRRWARMNHVSAADRSADWDPVILDEMRRKDVDAASPLAERRPSMSGVDEIPAAIASYRPEPPESRSSAGYGYVPLVPDDHLIRVAHPAHDRLADPNLLQRIERLARIAEPAE